MTYKNSKGIDFPKLKRIVILADLFALLAAAVVISSWYAEPPSTDAMAETDIVCFADDSRLLYAGDIITTEIKNADGSTVVYESADKTVAVANPDGTIRGVSPGKTTVTAAVTYENTSETDILTMSVEVFRKEVPSDSDLPYWYEDEIFLINSDNPVGPDFEPELINVRKSIPTAHKETKLTPACEEALAAMYSDFLKENIGNLRLISTYRSYQKQETLINNAIKQRMKDYGMTKEQARASVLKTRMEPGKSEHHSGLAIDFSTVYTTQNNFHKTAQGKWLTENAHKYGFVLRYPESKAEITRISFEPWHFRFIETEHSVEHATYIYEHDLCLEEYIELQKQAKQAAEEYARNNPLE